MTKNGIGILTFALNSEHVDYEKLAYLMAISYIATNKHKLPLAVVVNDRKNCLQKLHNVFDHVITKKDFECVNAMHHESHLLDYTPFAETIKIESDMLLTGDIYHWIKHLRLMDLCFTNTIYGFDNQTCNDYFYRKYIYQNNLPNIYNGFMYVRYCEYTYNYFDKVNFIFHNWNDEKKNFRMFDNFEPSTDFAMAMACHYTNDIKLGVNPTGVPGFIHAKPWVSHNNNLSWHEYFNWSIVDPNTVIVEGVKAKWPIHYYSKDFCTDKIIQQYEQAI